MDRVSPPEYESKADRRADETEELFGDENAKFFSIFAIFVRPELEVIGLISQ